MKKILVALLLCMMWSSESEAASADASSGTKWVTNYPGEYNSTWPGAPFRTLPVNSNGIQVLRAGQRAYFAIRHDITDNGAAETVAPGLWGPCACDGGCDDGFDWAGNPNCSHKWYKIQHDDAIDAEVECAPGKYSPEGNNPLYFTEGQSTGHDDTVAQTNTCTTGPLFIASDYAMVCLTSYHPVAALVGGSGALWGSSRQYAYAAGYFAIICSDNTCSYKKSINTRRPILSKWPPVGSYGSGTAESPAPEGSCTTFNLNDALPLSDPTLDLPTGDPDPFEKKGLNYGGQTIYFSSHDSGLPTVGDGISWADWVDVITIVGMHDDEVQ